MSLIQTLKNKLNVARKEGKTVEMSRLQVVLGDATMLEGKKGTITDQEVENIIRVAITNNNKTIHAVKKVMVEAILGKNPVREDGTPFDLKDNLQEAEAVARQSPDAVYHMTNADVIVSKVQDENAYLTEFLPKTLSVQEIKEALGEMQEAIKSAPKEGQAMGIAMKFVKTKGLVALGDDVSAAVKELRQ